MHEFLDWLRPILSNFKANLFTVVLEVWTAQLKKS